MVSVKTELEFVVVASGGREDLFSDVTVGELGSVFICLPLTEAIICHQNPKLEESPETLFATDHHKPIKHHLVG